MPREYAPVAPFEPSFILADVRYKTLPPATKVLYVALWCRAVQDRRETLGIHYDTVAMQSDSSLDARTVHKSVAILQQRCLIGILGDGRVRVNGIKKKVRIGWKDNGVNISPSKGEIKTKRQHQVEKGVILPSSSSKDIKETTSPNIPHELQGTWMRIFPLTSF